MTRNEERIIKFIIITTLLCVGIIFAMLFSFSGIHIPKMNINPIFLILLKHLVAPVLLGFFALSIFDKATGCVLTPVSKAALKFILFGFILWRFFNISVQLNVFHIPNIFGSLGNIREMATSFGAGLSNVIVHSII